MSSVSGGRVADEFSELVSPDGDVEGEHAWPVQVSGGIESGGNLDHDRGERESRVAGRVALWA
jgi:hypothetical protein